MKLRSLSLTNVRRFGGQTAKLGPFGDGLTTITAHNEAGKSTFFDALHALFFLPHNSKAQEVRALQPYSGGAVGIMAEVEVNNVLYRIEKTYLSQAGARIVDTTTELLLKQQGDAEEWIETQINTHSKGPAGLLWVRQGDTHVDPEGRGKDAENIAARRDLMSSVRGQIDAITGGRRMDRIVERCRKEFDALSTQGFKAKAGSPWKKIEDKIAVLAVEHEKLTADVAKLSQALRAKTATQKRLRQLQDPEQETTRATQIAKAKAALDLAQQHAENIAKADQAVQLAEAALEKCTREIKEITDARARRMRLSALIAQTNKEATQASKDRATAEEALAETSAEMAENDTVRRTLAIVLNEARTAEKRHAKWHRLHQIANLLGDLEAPQQRLAAAQTALHSPDITEQDVASLTDLSQQISVAREQRRAHFASVTLTPDAGQTAKRDGQSLPTETPQLIDRPMVISLEGYGVVQLHPAQGAGLDIADPDVLKTELEAALVRLGFDSVSTVRSALTARLRAQSDAQIAQAEIKGLAPDGVAGLHEEYEELCVEVGHPPKDTLPDVVTKVDQVAETEAKIASLEAVALAIKARLAARQQTATQATTAEATAQGVLKHQLEEQALDPEPADIDPQLAILQTQHSEITKNVALARAARDDLCADAPNHASAEATFHRLQSAAKADRDEIETLNRDLARADGAIEAQSEGAVEETLAEVTDKLEAAKQRSARYDLQARALKLLIDHLDAARKAAQDTYFEPIRAELHPLLAQLHQNAVFELDPEKMLVGKITRDGVTDEVGALSGGAYEQVAILTRLAFAKLFAKRGHHVPVILDDALVHTDDDRIMRMFDMLSQAAQDQQIIVLSCRTRAFSDLGGTRASITISD